MNECPNCKQPCDSVRSIIKQQTILTGCDVCLPQQMQKGDSAGFYRRAQQVQYRKDLTQPNQPREFIKAYPDIARERYGKDTYRKFS